jgi:hypothetical protein
LSGANFEKKTKSFILIVCEKVRVREREREKERERGEK